jgi:hypothetical protein
LEEVCKALPGGRWLSLGLVDGRNIWKTALTDAERLIERAQELRGGALMVAPSCSLLHVPVDLEPEALLDEELKNWLAFAVQKLDEVAALAAAGNGARDSRYFLENARALGSRATSRRIYDPNVKARLAAVTPESGKASAEYATTGENLDKDAVKELYLTNGKDDIKLEIVAQKADSIQFKVPGNTKPARYTLMILTADGKQFMEQPVKLTIE